MNLIDALWDRLEPLGWFRSDELEMGQVVFLPPWDTGSIAITTDTYHITVELGPNSLHGPGLIALGEILGAG